MTLSVNQGEGSLPVGAAGPIEAPPASQAAPDASPDAELSRLEELPLDQRAAALAQTVQHLEEELDATETPGAGT